MSLIYFKLKNAIQQQSVTFDGSVIQIGDVKRLVAERQGLGAEGYQEITLYDPNTGNEYDDDSKVIPRNTLVEVKRTPAATFAPLTSNPGGVAVEDEPVPMVQDDESQALQNLMQGTASTWQREVRQGAMKGRGGRGRGAVPAEYRCPRCEVYGAHWLQDCPTHGDPTYDRKRVRPPVGIPMTRLARSSEGGLVLPDGNTGTLVANEDAFAKEVLGIGAVNHINGGGGGGDVLAIEGAGGDDGQKKEQEDKASVVPQAVGFMPFSISAMGAPQLAGMSLKLKKDTKSTALSEKDERLFELMKYPDLPKGPRDFILKAYDRDEPLSREEFEREQDHYNYKKGGSRGSQRDVSRRRDRSQSRSDRRRDRRRSRSRSHSRSRSERHRDYRRRSRSRSRSRDRYDDSRRRRRDDKDDESRHRRDGHRRSRPSRSKSPKRSSQKTSEQVSKKIPVEEPKKQTTKSDVGGNSLKETKGTKHSPIRWSQPTSKEGAKFAGQDEEPDIDYGESEEEADEIVLKVTEKRKDKKRGDDASNKRSSGSKRGQQRTARDSRERDYGGRSRRHDNDRYRGGESPRRRGADDDDDDRGSGRRKGKEKDHSRSNNKGRNRNARR